MEAKKFIIRYGCNDFVFEGAIPELTSILKTLERLTPVLVSSTAEAYKETVLQKRLLIYSARKEVEADDTIYVIGDTRYLL